MPGMDGIEASRQIMASNHNIKIILVSSDLTDDVIGRALLAQFDGLMSKESIFNELAYAIDIVSTGRRYFCPKTITRIAKFIGT